MLVYMVHLYKADRFMYTVTQCVFETRNAAILWMTKQPDPNSYGVTGMKYVVEEVPVLDVAALT